MKKDKKTLTLIELIVVISIIAVLAAVIAPILLQSVEKSKISQAVSDFKMLKKAYEALYLDISMWPDDNCEESLLSNDDCSGGSFSGWDGPYVKNLPTTPWEGPYSIDNDDDCYNMTPTGPAELGDGVNLFWYIGHTTLSEGEFFNIATKLDTILDSDNNDTSGVFRRGTTWLLYLVDVGNCPE